jgi:uncharacterized membrane protein YdbT with pleckstrin-like domain
MTQFNSITRQSLLILNTQLVLLEGFISTFSYVIKLPLVNGWFDNLFIYTIVTIIIQVINILFIMMIVLRWINTEYRIENGSLIIKRGIVSIKEKTYALDNVETVEIEQNWIGRIFGYGSVNIFSPLFQEHVYLWNIPHPQKFVSEMKQYIPTGSRVTVAPRR